MRIPMLPCNTETALSEAALSGVLLYLCFVDSLTEARGMRTFINGYSREIDIGVNQFSIKSCH